MLAKNKTLTGNIGERFAEEYLIKKDFNIIHKNINFSNQEIDLIAEKKQKYYIVEVKTSSYYSLVDPEDYLNQKKIKNLKIAAHQFSQKNNIRHEDIFFDFIAIKLNKNNELLDLNHYENIC